MPLLLPFFKFDVQAWLTSETVMLMKNEQRGAFVQLLTKAWACLTCTLPNDIDRVKSLADWEGSDTDFERVWTCWIPDKKQPNRLINKRLMKEWKEAKTRQAFYAERAKAGADARWAPKQSRPRKTTAHEPPKDWLAELKSKPIYAHINWERELGKIDEWHSRAENKNRVINQRFVANWVNKIEPPLTNGHAVNPLHCDKCNKDYPDLAAKKTHDFAYHPKYVG